MISDRDVFPKKSGKTLSSLIKRSGCGNIFIPEPVFVQIEICICLNCKMYLSSCSIYLSNCKMHLSNSQLYDQEESRSAEEELKIFTGNIPVGFVWIVIEKSSDAPYYCHPRETESFRKQSYPPPPHHYRFNPTRPPYYCTYSVHRTNIQRKYGTEMMGETQRGWGN